MATRWFNVLPGFDLNNQRVNARVRIPEQYLSAGDELKIGEEVFVMEDEELLGFIATVEGFGEGPTGVKYVVVTEKPD